MGYLYGEGYLAGEWGIAGVGVQWGFVGNGGAVEG